MTEEPGSGSGSVSKNKIFRIRNTAHCTAILITFSYSEELLTFLHFITDLQMKQNDQQIHEPSFEKKGIFLKLLECFEKEIFFSSVKKEVHSLWSTRKKCNLFGVQCSTPRPHLLALSASVILRLTSCSWCASPGKVVFKSFLHFHRPLIWPEWLWSAVVQVSAGDVFLHRRLPGRGGEPWRVREERIRWRSWNNCWKGK